jgi:hypothetical protein
MRAKVTSLEATLAEKVVALAKESQEKLKYQGLYEEY